MNITTRPPPKKKKRRRDPSPPPPPAPSKKEEDYHHRGRLSSPPSFNQQRRFHPSHVRRSSRGSGTALARRLAGGWRERHVDGSVSHKAVGVGQYQWDPILVGRRTTPFRTYFSGDWDVHWGYGILTHGHMGVIFFREEVPSLALADSLMRGKRKGKDPHFEGSPILRHNQSYPGCILT